MDIQRELSKLKPYLRGKHGVKKIGVTNRTRETYWMGFFYLKDYLEKKLGR